MGKQSGDLVHVTFDDVRTGCKKRIDKVSRISNASLPLGQVGVHNDTVFDRFPVRERCKECQDYWLEQMDEVQ